MDTYACTPTIALITDPYLWGLSRTRVNLTEASARTSGLQDISFKVPSKIPSIKTLLEIESGRE
jgi:hypothetical protein